MNVHVVKAALNNYDRPTCSCLIVAPLRFHFQSNRRIWTSLVLLVVMENSYNGLSIFTVQVLPVADS